MVGGGAGAGAGAAGQGGSGRKLLPVLVRARGDLEAATLLHTGTPEAPAPFSAPIVGRAGVSEAAPGTAVLAAAGGSCRQ